MNGSQPSHGFAPLDLDFITDPYPAYAYLREHDPVHQLPSGYWVITSYDHVLTTLKDPRFSNAPPPFSILSADKRDKNIAAEIVNNIFHLQGAAQHARGRQLVGKAYFNALKRRPPDLNKISENLITELRGKGKFDVIEEFANPFTTGVICDVLGIPNRDLKFLSRLSKNFFYLFNMKTAKIPSKPVERGLRDFRDYVRELFEERRREPQQDLLSDLCHEASPENRLSDDEIICACMLLFSDGIENVNAAIGIGLMTFHKYPEQLAKLENNPELLSSAVDECLRFDSPAQFLVREALEDVTLGDKQIPKGSIVLSVVASANRDERHFEDADQFDITRKKNPHLSFGRGRHMCLGAALAKGEIEAALGALIKHMKPNSCRLEDVSWALSIGHRWPTGVRVELQR